MARSQNDTAVLTIRVPVALERRLAREARRRRQTRSELARTILHDHLEPAGEPDAATEARRQSLLVSRRRSERDALAFNAAVADTRDWR